MSTSRSCRLVQNGFPNTNECSPALSFSAKAITMFRSPSTVRSRSVFKLRRDRKGFFPFCLQTEEDSNCSRTVNKPQQLGLRICISISLGCGCVQECRVPMNYVCCYRMASGLRQSCQGTCKIERLYTCTQPHKYWFCLCRVLEQVIFRHLLCMGTNGIQSDIYGTNLSMLNRML